MASVCPHIVYGIWMSHPMKQRNVFIVPPCPTVSIRDDREEWKLMHCSKQLTTRMRWIRLCTCLFRFSVTPRYVEYYNCYFVVSREIIELFSGQKSKQKKKLPVRGSVGLG